MMKRRAFRQISERNWVAKTTVFLTVRESFRELLWRKDMVYGLILQGCRPGASALALVHGLGQS